MSTIATTRVGHRCEQGGCSGQTVYLQRDQKTGREIRWCREHYTRRFPTAPFAPRPSASDRMTMAMADWHDAVPLMEYRNTSSVAYQRDLNQYGVYIISELVANNLVPRFIEVIPKYVGMSIDLSKRLHQHATGSNSNPAEHATMEWLLVNASEEEMRAFANASAPEQRAIMAICVERRNLYARTAHTGSKETADMLERSMTRLFESQGIQLWNKIKFATTAPFARPKPRDIT